MLASRRHDRTAPLLHWGSKRIQLTVSQFGAIIGDGCNIAYGCHINPGTVVGRDSLILPLVDLRGYIAPNSLVRIRQQIQVSRLRPMPRLRPHVRYLDE
ncbi:hypothetical protein LUPAC06_02282 [Micromonospora saelicesensis]|nr:hypothetical protein LUPAC06_02282 [Micromonospora saelicesensis]